VVALTGCAGGVAWACWRGGEGVLEAWHGLGGVIGILEVWHGRGNMRDGVLGVNMGIRVL